MALTELFTDRKARKFIRESINEAAEIGKGICSLCGHEHRLLQAFEGVALCEHCATKALELSEDFEQVFDCTPSSGQVMDLLNEDYFYVDTTKLEMDAQTKFNGSVPDVLRSYGIKPAGGKYGWNERYHKGIVWISPTDVKNTGKGNLNLNRFLSDYSAQGVGNKIPTLNPDSDGFSYTIPPAEASFKARAESGSKNSVFTQPNGYIEAGVRGAKPAASPAKPKTVPAVPTQPATPATPAPKQASQNTQVTAKPAAPTPKATQAKRGNITVSGTKANWYIPIGKGSLKLMMTLASENGNTYTYKVEMMKGNTSKSSEDLVIKVDNLESNLGKAGEAVIDAVLENPGKYIPAFYGESGKAFSINRYGVYDFTFDEASLASGKDITLAIVYKGSTVSSKRVVISDDALLNRATLNSQLVHYMDEMVSKKYPTLFSKDASFKTSFGKVTMEFHGFNDKDNPVVSILIGSQEAGVLPFEKDKDVFTNPSKAREDLMSALMTIMNKIIPGFGDDKLMQTGSDTYKVPVSGLGKGGATVFADFDFNAFFDRGDVAFNIRVQDDVSGTVKPDKPETFIYRKTRTPLTQFLTQVGTQLYRECFNKSAMTSTMTQSAQAKMKSPGKKQALFDKIAGIFIKKHPEVKLLKSCEVEAEIEVNKDGKVIDASITVRDPYEDESTSSRDLASKLNLEKAVKYLKFFKAHPEQKEGPAVTYKVDNIEAFSVDMDLAVLEHLIFEAFGICHVNESGRKVIYV